MSAPLTPDQLDEADYAQQWNYQALGDMDAIWAEYTGRGVRVGIFDTAIDLSHPELFPNYDASLNLVTGGQVLDPDFSGEPGELSSPGSLNFHGTAVAGIIAAARNDYGMVGIAYDAKFAIVPGVGVAEVPVDDFDQYQIDFYEKLSDFDVTNHSWATKDFNSGGAPFQDIQSVVPMPLADVSAHMEQSLDIGRNGLGTINIKSVGNDREFANTAVFNSDRGFIVVSGFDPEGMSSRFNNWGSPILVSAPSQGSDTLPLWTTGPRGPDVYNSAAGPEGDYDDVEGTSFASPHVTGIVALMLEANPNLGWRDVQKILAVSARHVGSDYGAPSDPSEVGVWGVNDAGNWNGGGMTYHNNYGFGAVDARGAIRMAEAWSQFGKAQTSSNEFRIDGFQGLNLGLTIPALESYTSFDYQIALAGFKDFRIESVEVKLDVTHASLGHLYMSLVSPNGTISQLHGQGDPLAIGKLDWADGGFETTYGSRNFYGEGAIGTWQIRFDDSRPSPEAGILNGFQLIIHGSRTGKADVYHYTDEIRDLVADDPSRLALDDAGGNDWMNLAAITGNIELRLKRGFGTIDGDDFVALTENTWIENAFGGDGDDLLSGTQGRNRLVGARGDDTIHGRAGNDRLGGHQDDDILRGGAGNDRIFGGSGNDVLRGGVGRDLLVDGGGSDVMYGGANADVFILHRDGARDVVRDFDVEVDHLRLLGVRQNEVSITAIQADRVRITYGDDVLIVMGQWASQLADPATAAAFIDFG